MNDSHARLTFHCLVGLSCLGRSGLDGSNDKIMVVRLLDGAPLMFLLFALCCQLKDLGLHRRGSTHRKQNRVNQKILA